ncbi:MAG: type II toxin-antitoxin system Phd/YefM family antitoxin [Ignavibacteriales bacterium]
MEIGVFEARNRFSELIDMAEAGEEVVVLRRGKPVAKIVPMTDREALAERRRRVVAEMRAQALEIAERNGRPFTHAELMEARDKGKR